MGTGTGKTAIMRDKLRNMDAEITCSSTINMNSFSDAPTLQPILEQPLEKKSGMQLRNCSQNLLCVSLGSDVVALRAAGCLDDFHSAFGSTVAIHPFYLGTVFRHLVPLKARLDCSAFLEQDRRQHKTSKISFGLSW